MKTILLTCAETSGDHHAAGLIRCIRRLDPSCRIVALGGSEMREAGAEVVFPMEEYAFMGFSEVVHALPRVMYLERKLKSMLRRAAVDLFVPVDYPGLNLRLARFARRHGVPVLYFISPQVWAWGGWRIRAIRSAVDLMVVILPFEEQLYRRAGIPVLFIGHPMLGEIPPPPSPKCAPSGDEAFTVLLFPGSRKQEVQRLLPPVIGAARLLRQRFPRARFRLGLAPLIPDEAVNLPTDLRDVMECTREGVSELASAAIVLAASGTVTLQAALSGTPVVVFYVTSPVTYLLGRILVRIPHIAMPNVLAEKRIVPELIQHGATPAGIADEATALLRDGERYVRVSRELIALRERLKGLGGVPFVADIAMAMAGGGDVSGILADLDEAAV